MNVGPTEILILLFLFVLLAAVAVGARVAMRGSGKRPTPRDDRGPGH